MCMDMKRLIICVLLYTVSKQIDFFISGVALTPKKVDILEKTDLMLSCSNSGRNLNRVRWERNGAKVAMEHEDGRCITYHFLLDQNLYLFSCTNMYFNVTLKNISRYVNGDTWKCWDIDSNESNNVTIRVKVQVQTVTITPNERVFTTVENRALSSLQCISSECRPEPTFLWYIDRNTKSRQDDIELLKYNPSSTSKDTIVSYYNPFDTSLNRTMNGWYLFCGATNSISDITISDKILLNITYPPDIAPWIAGLENEVEYIITEGNYVNLTCSVTGGYPLPILQWNRNKRTSQVLNGSTVTNTIFWQASRVDQGVLTCASIHINKEERTSVNIIVIFPPDKPSISIKTSAGEFRIVMNTIDVTEQTPFTIICSANSNPPVSKFEWSGLLQSNSSLLYITKKDRSESTVTCKVINHMKETQAGETVTGTNSTSLKVNVLYPPTVNILSGNKRTITEGDNFVYLCNVTQGNPKVTDVTWNWGDQKWYGHHLTVHNVSRTESRVYQCCANNTMVSSDLTTVFSKDCASIQLNVEFQTKVLYLIVNEQNSLYNLTVNEDDTLNIACEIEGNPMPEGNMKLDGTFGIQNKLLDINTTKTSKETYQNLQLFSTLFSTCTDAGKYTCTGWNRLQNGSETASTKSFTLFVKCKPRKSPYHEIPDRVFSDVTRDVTISFTALAYPVPPESGYIWSKKTGSGEWTTINVSSNDSKIVIATSGLKSDLTIKNITELDYGLYKLRVENDIGIYQHTFNLTAKDADKKESFQLGLAAIGAIGSVSLLVVMVFAIAVYKRSAKRSESYSLRDVHEADDSDANHNPQAVTTYSSFQTGNSNVYEELHSAAGDDYSTLNSGNPNMYEELQQSGHASYSTINGGKQNVYEEIKNPGEHKLYQNLQMTSINKAVQDG